MELPIFWHEGQFVRPQHFQVQDRAQRDYAHRLAVLTLPYPWGVSKLQVSESALDKQSLEVTACDAVFADGTAVTFPGNCRIHRRQFSGYCNKDHSAR